jgi:hypothetical protein
MQKENFKPGAHKASYVEAARNRWRNGLQRAQPETKSGGYTGDGDSGIDLTVAAETKKWLARQDWTRPKPYDGD